MASVDLTGIPIRRAVPRPLRYGGVVGSELGGGSLKIRRLGGRWAWQFETVPMLMTDPTAPGDGQYWSGMLTQAEDQGALLAIEQPGFDTGVPGAPFVGTGGAPSGRVVPVGGLTAGYQVRRGQWLSVTTATGRYLDQNWNDTVADGDGNTNLLIANLIRSPMAFGDAIELAAPKIEGLLTGLDSWEVDVDGMTVFAFTIEEAR